MTTAICELPGCSKPRGSARMCSMHYSRLKRTGTTDPGLSSPTLTPLERWLANVTLGDECWEWSGGRASHGYAWLALGGNRREYVHRWAYRNFVGPIPDGWTVDHLCFNKACSRLDHLEAVTNEENVLRGAEKRYGRLRNDPRCRHGHELTPENTGTDGGKRYCRECRNSYKRRKRAEQKAAA